MRVFRAIAISLVIAAAAFARESSEVPFTIVSATVQTFERPKESREGVYSEALVVRLDASRADYEALPPSIAAFLYIGSHELRPRTYEVVEDRVIVTFHDPRWRELQGGEPMVLTIDHGEPVNDPDRYRSHPRFDPGIISGR